MRILVVEDTDDIRELFTLLLAEEGAKVTAAANGRDAIEAAARGDFDVLLTDLGLPDIPGDIVIRAVLDQARHRPRVVVVTGYGEPYQARALEAGADVVLTKPVSWSTLLEHLGLPDRDRVAA
jgi:two-component system CheB/CheR fusion protein